MWLVLQITEKQTVKWFDSDSFDFLCGFCQYMIDSANPDGLENFWVYWTNGEKVKKKTFYEFCEIQEIKKRTFEERMAGSEIDDKAMRAWAEIIRANDTK